MNKKIMAMMFSGVAVFVLAYPVFAQNRFEIDTLKSQLSVQEHSKVNRLDKQIAAKVRQAQLQAQERAAAEQRIAEREKALQAQANTRTHRKDGTMYNDENGLPRLSYNGQTYRLVSSREYTTDEKNGVMKDNTWVCDEDHSRITVKMRKDAKAAACPIYGDFWDARNPKDAVEGYITGSYHVVRYKQEGNNVKEIKYSRDAEDLDQYYKDLATVDSTRTEAEIAKQAKRDSVRVHQKRIRNFDPPMVEGGSYQGLLGF